MDIALFLFIGTVLVFLGGKDPVLVWIALRKEGRSISKSTVEIIPMFILPWPRTVNKRLLWLGAGSFLIGSGVHLFIARFL